MFIELLSDKINYLINEDDLKKLPKFCGGKIFHINKFNNGAVIYIYFGNFIKEEVESLKYLIDTPLYSPFEQYNIEIDNTICRSITILNELGRNETNIVPSIAQQMKGHKYYTNAQIEEEWKNLAQTEFGNSFDLYLKLNKAKFNEFLKENLPIANIAFDNDNKNIVNLENEFNKNYALLKQEFNKNYPKQDDEILNK